jgi:hypothetical protein
MMEKQNITLAIPKDILRKAKKIAIDHNVSLSGLMVELLTNLIEQEERYAIAKQKHLTWLAQGADLGTKGTISWSRESLYER